MQDEPAAVAPSRNSRRERGPNTAVAADPVHVSSAPFILIPLLDRLAHIRMCGGSACR